MTTTGEGDAKARGPTPGPWTLGAVDRHGYQHVHARGWIGLAEIPVEIRDEADRKSYVPSAEGEANARQIAASPRLMAVLTRLVAAVDSAAMLGDPLKIRQDSPFYRDATALIAEILGRPAPATEAPR